MKFYPSNLLFLLTTQLFCVVEAFQFLPSDHRSVLLFRSQCYDTSKSGNSANSEKNRHPRVDTVLFGKGSELYSDATTNGNLKQDISLGPLAGLMASLKRSFFRISRVLWSLKRAIRARTEKYTIYVLECENGKFYVGSTSHKRQRFKQHMGTRGGSMWTRMHKVIRVLKQYKRVPSAYYLGLEAKVTAEYMLKFGVNNVRGAMFAQTRQYTQDDLEALTGFLGHYNDLKYTDVASALQKTLPLSTAVPKKSNGKQMKSRKKRRYSKNHFSNGCDQLGHLPETNPNTFN